MTMRTQAWQAVSLHGAMHAEFNQTSLVAFDLWLVASPASDLSVTLLA